MYKQVLIINKIAKLRATIETITKRKSRKRKYVQYQGTLTVEEGSQLAAAEGGGGQEGDAESSKDGRAVDTAPQKRRCGHCGKTGHNARTCQVKVSESSESESVL